MRSFIFTICLLITIAFTWLLNNQIPNTPIPPLGKLFNPFTGFWQNTNGSDFIVDSLALQGINEAVQIAYDDRMVPHIFAKNDIDLHFAQGYIVAKHRFFQMDMTTRKAAGRLSEITEIAGGKPAINIDKIARRMGMVWAAENTLNAWKKSEKEYPKLQAFVKGVNAFVNSLEPKDYPIEYKLMDFKPEPWSELKTALLSKEMARTLSSRELDRSSTNALSILGRETFDFLYPEYNPKQSPIIPEDVKWDFINPLTSSTADPQNDLSLAPERPFELTYEGIGSNNWAVAGQKTASGYPILCNDPHLKLSLPSVWFEIQLHSPTQNTYGVTLPGMPGIMLGFNENVAWGFTNVGHDVLDWYAIDWASADKESYFLDGKIVKVDKVIETYHAKGYGTLYDTVKYTVWGPIVHESKDSDNKDLAMKWLPHTSSETDELSAFSKLNKAKNYNDYSDALQHYSSPAQNMAFASKDGDIALKVQGRFPIKNKEQGRFIQDGSKSSNNWKGFIPKEQIPAVKNPARGFVASANQHSTSPDYPYYYNGSFEDFRGRILNRILSKMDKITPEDMMALQNNNFSIKAEEALPQLLKYVDITDLDETDLAFYNELKEWNYKYIAEGHSPILFEEWYQTFRENTWDELAPYAAQIGNMPVEDWRMIELLSEQPNHAFFDKKSTTKIETAKEIAHQSFKEMSNTVQNLEIDNGATLKWYQYRELSIPHLTAIPAFSRNLLKVGGSPNALNAIRGRKNRLGGWGPSWRMVVAFGEGDVEAYGIYPGGQSGNPASPYYDNMIDDWAAGKYYKLHYLKSVKDLGEHTLHVESWEPD